MLRIFQLRQPAPLRFCPPYLHFYPCSLTLADAHAHMHIINLTLSTTEKHPPTSGLLLKPQPPHVVLLIAFTHQHYYAWKPPLHY